MIISRGSAGDDQSILSDSEDGYEVNDPPSFVRKNGPNVLPNREVLQVVRGNPLEKIQSILTLHGKESPARHIRIEFL